jgi:hypothetical protein
MKKKLNYTLFFHAYTQRRYALGNTHHSQQIESSKNNSEKVSRFSSSKLRFVFVSIDPRIVVRLPSYHSFSATLT